MCVCEDDMRERTDGTKHITSVKTYAVLIVHDN